MKNLIIAILSVSLLSFTGCCATNKPQPKPKTVQKAPVSYKSLWSESAAAYVAFCLKSAQSKSASAKQGIVDNAWNEFCQIYKASYTKSNGNGAPPTALVNSASKLKSSTK